MINQRTKLFKTGGCETLFKALYLCSSLEIFRLYQTKIINLWRDLTWVVVGIGLLGILLAHCWEQEHRTFELSAPGAICHGNISMIVRPVGRSGDRLLVWQLQSLNLRRRTKLMNRMSSDIFNVASTNNSRSGQSRPCYVPHRQGSSVIAWAYSLGW